MIQKTYILFTGGLLQWQDLHYQETYIIEKVPWKHLRHLRARKQ